MSEGRIPFRDSDSGLCLFMSDEYPSGAAAIRDSRKSSYQCIRVGANLPSEQECSSWPRSATARASASINTRETIVTVRAGREFSSSCHLCNATFKATPIKCSFRWLTPSHDRLAVPSKFISKRESKLRSHESSNRVIRLSLIYRHHRNIIYFN